MTTEKIKYYSTLAITLLPSSLLLIVWREFGGGEPQWLYLIPLIGLCTFLLVTFFSESLKSLRSYGVFLLILFLFGYGGGWSFGIIPWIRVNAFWMEYTSCLPLKFSDVSIHILRLSPAIVILITSKIQGKSFQDQFLVLGDVNKIVKPTKLLGIKDNIRWLELSLRFSFIFGLGTATFLVLATKPNLSLLLDLEILPFAIFIAGINAFNEEFTLRAVPLSLLSKEIGDENALIITTTFFALGHYYGVPYGIIGVILSAFLGWFIGKSILETRGFLLAWIAHFIPDLVIFGFLLIYT